MSDETAALAFVEKLGRALHAYGTPTHRLEDALARVSALLGLEGQFFATPTAIFASFAAGGEQRVVLLRMQPGDVHLEKLDALDEVLAGLTAGRLSAAEAGERVDRIVAAPPRFGSFATTASFALVSATAARFFGGGWPEIASAAGVGLLTGLVALVAARRQGTSQLFEPVAATLAAFLASLAASVYPVSPYVVMLAGLIVLVPGLTLTVAMNELATRNLVSGSARLAGAALVFLTIGIGVALGRKLAALVVAPSPAAVPVPLAGWTEGVALAVVALAFTVLFRARPRDVGWILAGGTVALLGSRLGAARLGPELGALAGAALVGVTSNLFARLADRPAAIPQLPGLMLLVPGAIGFRGLASLLDQDVLGGVQAAFTMTFVAIALVTGLLMANVLVPPRRVL